jgi:hypothetical protein
MRPCTLDAGIPAGDGPQKQKSYAVLRIEQGVLIWRPIFNYEVLSWRE